MATSRYVALTPIRHNGKLFAVGDALALTDAQAASLGSAIAPQAGALPAMPPDPPVPVLATPSPLGLTKPKAGGVDAIQRNQPIGKIHLKRFGKIETNSSMAGNTIAATHDVDFPWVAVQARVYCATTSVVAGHKTYFGVSDVCNEADASIYTPSGAGTLTPFLFSGANTFTPNVATLSSGADIIPGVIESDILYAPSLPKANGQPGGYAMVRSLYPAASPGTRGSMNNPPNFATNKVWQSYAAGDVVASGGTFNGQNGVCPAVELVFYGPSNVRTIVFAGDSTFGGLDDTEVPIGGWTYRATKAINDASSGVKAVPILWGHASQQSSTYLKNLLAAITYARPHAAVFCPFSPNDSDKYTTAGEQRQILGMYQFLAACDAAGTIPMLSTPIPVNGLTQAQEASRRLVAAKVRELTQIVTVLDFDLQLNNYASVTGGFAVAADGSGTVHCTPQGHAKQAALALPLIAAAIGVQI